MTTKENPNHDYRRTLNHYHSDYFGTGVCGSGYVCVCICSWGGGGGGVGVTVVFVVAVVVAL